jgi:hypothetical protein
LPIGASCFIFQIREEEKPTLLLHLPKVLAETADFDSASDLGCRLVVAFLQAEKPKQQHFSN